MSKKSKSTSGPSKFAKPFITQGANLLQSSYAAQNPIAQQNAGTIQGGIPGLAAKAFGSDPLLAQAQGYGSDVLSGKYLEAGNPHLEQMTNLARGHAIDAAGARAGALGGYGGSDWQENVGRGASEAELGLRYSDYNAERDRMAQASAGAPNLINAEYAGILPLLSAIQAQGETAMGPANNLAQGYAGLLGNYQTKSGGPNFMQALSDRAADAAKAFAASGSDRRLKTAIRKIGEFADGLGLYVWRYLHGVEGEYVGVMADEVARLRPWALGPTIGGYSTVRYGLL